MPVKWTPETDQILLLKILETSDVSPRCALIAEKWPANLERPTPRAISERIFKIRAAAKASGTASHFTVPSTPRKKNTTSATKKTNGPKGGVGKRKRGGMMSDEEDAGDDSESDGFKSDDTGSDASDVKLLFKKAKVNSTREGKGKHPAKVKMEEVANGALYDNSHEIDDENGATEVIDFA